MSRRLKVIFSTCLVAITALSLGGCASHKKISTQPKKIQVAKQAKKIKHEDILKYSNDTAKQVGGFGQNTTGGAKATKAHTYVVTNGKQLHNALTKNTNHQPRKIVIDGNIDVSIDKDGNHLNQVSYVHRVKGSQYNFDDYLRAFNPKAKMAARNNRENQKKARKQVAKMQRKQIEINVPSNTTIIGMPKNKIIGAEFNISQPNVIMRNLNIEAPKDQFPKWNMSGHKWQPEYSSIVLHNARNVWLDHNSFTDQPNIDHSQKHLGAIYKQHKDFINAYDGVKGLTVSNNSFSNHHKVAEIGSNKAKIQSQVTFAHNMFMDTASRMPSVTNGQVDILSNVYSGDTIKPYIFQRAWMLNQNSSVFAKDNDFIFHSKNSYNKHLASINASGNKHFTEVNTRVNGVKSHALTKQEMKKVKSQMNFNHQLKAMKHGFGANLK